MNQRGLFNDRVAYDRLDKCADPLLRLDEEKCNVKNRFLEVPIKHLEDLKTCEIN
jgi:hypothetical protein